MLFRSGWSGLKPSNQYHSVNIKACPLLNKFFIQPSPIFHHWLFIQMLYTLVLALKSSLYNCDNSGREISLVKQATEVTEWSSSRKQIVIVTPILMVMEKIRNIIWS